MVWLQFWKFDNVEYPFITITLISTLTNVVALLKLSCMDQIELFYILIWIIDIIYIIIIFSDLNLKLFIGCVNK